jgi:hypothetical protein
VTIDIETENTGADIDLDNKRIISVQIGNVTTVELFYDDSECPEYGLSAAKDRIAGMISKGYVFSGYGLKRFDVEHIATFLGIRIPPSNLIDLSQTDFISESNRRYGEYKLEDVCRRFRISVEHKDRMNRKAETYKARSDVLALADREAPKIAAKKGGTVKFARDEAIRKITFGMAILDSYQEFVKKGGSKHTLFYQYATEDVVCEHHLFELVRQRQCPIA